MPTIMNNLLTAGRRSLVDTEIRRLKQAQSRQQSRRSRSQYTGVVEVYNAEEGHAVTRLPDGGIAYANTITNSALRTVAVSLPRRSTVGIADAKPTVR